MAKISIRRGRLSDGDVNQYHLVSNHLLHPEANFDKVLMYAEKRFLTTLLVSGARDSRFTVPGSTPSGGDTVATKIPAIPDNELVKGNMWAYKIMGRIQKSVEITGTAAVGTPTAATSVKGSTFTLAMKDTYLNPGMVVTFYNGKQARIQSALGGTEGRYLYTFEGYPGEQFDWSTWIAPQVGRKTCFGGYSSYGERSRIGYSNFHYPDTYVNHTTLQRKSMSISGDANLHDVIWYEIGNMKGFTFEAEAQMRMQFLLEDEHQKWWGKSNMKDEFGNLLDRSPMRDENGLEIVQGDGLIEQIRGSNDISTSGQLGKPTWDDFSDAIRAIKKKKNVEHGQQLIAITGSDGIESVEGDVLPSKFSSSNPIVQVVNQNGQIGGADVEVGYRMRKMNVGGESIIFVENPMMNDEERFPRRLSNGRLAMSNTFFLIDWNPMGEGKQNVEIRVAGRAGVNRNMVYYWENGMTGQGKPQNPVDAMNYHMLKQNMITMYNSSTSAIIEPPTTA